MQSGLQCSSLGESVPPRQTGHTKACTLTLFFPRVPRASCGANTAHDRTRPLPTAAAAIQLHDARALWATPSACEVLVRLTEYDATRHDESTVLVSNPQVTRGVFSARLHPRTWLVERIYAAFGGRRWSRMLECERADNKTRPASQPRSAAVSLMVQPHDFEETPSLPHTNIPSETCTAAARCQQPKTVGSLKHHFDLTAAVTAALPQSEASVVLVGAERASEHDSFNGACNARIVTPPPGDEVTGSSNSSHAWGGSAAATPAAGAKDTRAPLSQGGSQHQHVFNQSRKEEDTSDGVADVLPPEGVSSLVVDN